MSGDETLRVLIGCLKSQAFACSAACEHTYEHTNGTLYQLRFETIRLRSALEDDPVKFVVWKRYAELWTFYQKISKLFAQLYLRGDFPKLKQPEGFLRRRDPGSIPERLQEIQNLFVFVIRYPVLVQSQVFKDFLKDVLHDRTTTSGKTLVPEIAPSNQNREKQKEGKNQEDSNCCSHLQSTLDCVQDPENPEILLPNSQQLIPSQSDANAGEAKEQFENSGNIPRPDKEEIEEEENRSKFPENIGEKESAEFPAQIVRQATPEREASLVLPSPVHSSGSSDEGATSH